MDVTLCLGFLCNVYKISPTIRVFIENFFVDEFEAKNNISKKEIDLISKNYNDFTYINPNRISHCLDPKVIMQDGPFEKNVTFMFYNIKNLKQRNEKELKVLISIKNSDSNYNNGFITKSTMFSIPFIFVIPTKIFKNCSLFYQKWKQKMTFEKKLQTSLFDIKNYYRDRPRFFLFSTNPKHHTFNIKSSNKKNLSYFNGGDCEHERTFFKKHNFFTNSNQLGYMLFGDYNNLKKLIDKYSQYENQRSNS